MSDDDFREAGRRASTRRCSHASAKALPSRGSTRRAAPSNCWAIRSARTRSSTSPARTARPAPAGSRRASCARTVCAPVCSPARTWCGSTSASSSTASRSATRRSRATGTTSSRTSRSSTAELSDAGEAPLTFFEALTVLAFAAFADAPVDVAVIEVGMGGEWDSTNVGDGQVAVFTPISLDHTKRARQHGRRDRAHEVGHHQAGGRRRQRRAARRGARRAGARGRADRVDVRRAAGGVRRRDDRGRRRGPAGDHPGPRRDLRRPLPAALRRPPGAERRGRGRRGRDVPRPRHASRSTATCVEEGFATATSPGRLQLIGIEPSVLVDAAHNPSRSGERSPQALRTYFDFDEIAFVFGVLADKDVRGIIRALAPVATQFYVTQVRLGPGASTTTSSATSCSRRPATTRRSSTPTLEEAIDRRPRLGCGGAAARRRRHRLDHARRRCDGDRRGRVAGRPARERRIRDPTPTRRATPARPGRRRRAPARARRTRTVRESLGSIVLGFELIVVFLGALVLFGLKSPARRRRARRGSGARRADDRRASPCCATRSASSSAGSVQLVVIAAGLLVPAFFIVGAIFTAMWTYCMIVGAPDIDRQQPQRPPTQRHDHPGTENPE